MQLRKFRVRMVSVEKQRQSQPQQDSQLPPHAQFAVGADVEVSSDEEGFRGAWFLAKVLATPSKAQRNMYLVEYKSLVSEENGSDPLTEFVDASFVRPPLAVEEGDEVRFELDDVVEGRYCDGWWTGSVVEILGERRYRVFFKNPPHAIEFESSSLRFHRQWVDGKWIRPEKQTMRELALNPGTAVEINLGAQDSPYIWYVGTVVKEFSRRFFMVEYRINETELLSAVIDSLHIRLLPPRSIKNVFRLLERVDAYCNFAWSYGIVTKVLSDGRYIVFFKHTRKEKEMSYKDLRATVLHTDGSVVPSYQDPALVSNTQEQSDFNLDVNGKMSMPSEIFGGMKGNGGESRNDQEKQTLLDKPDQSAETEARLKNKQATKDKSSLARSFGKLNDPGRLKTPTSNGEGNSFTGLSASLARKLGAADKGFDSTRRWSFQGRRARGRGRLRGSVSRSPRSPVAGTASTIQCINEDHPGNEVILPCNTGQQNHLLSQSAGQLSVEKVGGELEKKDGPDDAVHDGIHVNDVNGGNLERQESRPEGSPARRKRGRPVGSLSGVCTTKSIGISGAFRRSTRERRTVYQSAPSSHKPRKKPRVMADILSSTQGPKRDNKRKSKVNSPTKVTQNPEPVSHDASPDDDHRPISSLFGEERSLALLDITREIPATVNGVDAAENDVTGREGFPFKKTSYIWNSIESLEVFQKIPQNPHFRPLHGVPQLLREGLAIGYMVTLSGLIEQIPKLQCSEPRNVLEGTMETLSELEIQGFDIVSIRNRVEHLLLLKTRLDRSQAKSEEAQAWIGEKEKKKAGIEKDMEELEKLMEELRQKQGVLDLQRQAADSEIGELQSKVDSTKKDFEEACVEFEMLVAAPW